MKYQLKQIAKDALPDEGEWLIAKYRILKTNALKFVLRSRALLRSSDVPDPETTYWIDPRLIHFHTNRKKKGLQEHFSHRVFHRVRDKGKVYSGDWDITTFRFSDLDIFQAIESRIVHGCDWRKTDYYRNMLHAVEQGRYPWGCRTQQDIDKRCHYIDALISSMKEEGYQPNHRVKLSSEVASIWKSKDFSDEVSVNISRDGEFLFQDGRHRLAIAQILKIEKIPIKVLVRHQKWVEFRRECLLRARGESGASFPGLQPQLAGHPDLQGIFPSHQLELKCSPNADA